MGKLVSVISGEIYDVAVDIRTNSATYGKHYGIRLSGDEKTHFWIPAGFLHGFVVRNIIMYNAIHTFAVRPYRRMVHM